MPCSCKSYRQMLITISTLFLLNFNYKLYALRYFILYCDIKIIPFVLKRIRKTIMSKQGLDMQVNDGDRTQERQHVSLPIFVVKDANYSCTVIIDYCLLNCTQF